MIVVPLVAYGDVWRARAQRCIRSLGRARIVVYTDKPSDFPGFETRPVPKGKKHKVNNYCYRQAREEFKSPLSPIAADMVCSAGLLDVLEAHHKAGKRLVCAPVPRVIEEEVGDLPTAPRDLAREAIRHLNPRQLDMARPTTVFRRHGSGLVANCFHAHPVLFDSAIGDIDSLDGQGVENIPNEETHVITDSDEALVVDVSSKDYDWDAGAMRISVLEFAKSVLPKHRWIFQHDCHIHYEDIPAA